LEFTTSASLRAADATKLLIVIFVTTRNAFTSDHWKAFCTLLGSKNLEKPIRQENTDINARQQSRASLQGYDEGRVILAGRLRPKGACAFFTPIPTRLRNWAVLAARESVTLEGKAPTRCRD